jgi:hypothetical protein
MLSKKTKYGIKAFFGAKKIKHRSLLLILQKENISVRKYPLTVAACWFFWVKKEKGGYY